MKAARLFLLVVGLLPVQALAAWPAETAWVPFQKAGVDVYDVASDHDADGTADASVDIVGDAILLAPAAYWYADDDALYLRMRVNEDPLLSATSFRASGWAFLLDTDAEPSTYEYQLGVTGPGGILELNENSTDNGLGPYDPVEDFTSSWADPLGDGTARVTDATTDIDSAPDWFIDLQFDRVVLDAVTGSALSGTFGVVVITEHLPGLVFLNNDVAGNDESLGAGAMPDDTTDPIGIDQDGDGLSDPEEAVLGTDPTDADTDDDGLGDETEVDGDTLPLVCDTDGDELSDGTEAGVVTPGADTDLTAGCFTPDGDPTTTTDPTLADTDRGGLPDGVEDRDGDGVWDPWETNPNDSDDDEDNDNDGLGDGIPDALEDACAEEGTPDDQDGDGILDTDEGRGDSDGDGIPDFCDPDDDEDGLPTSDEGVDDSDGDGLPDYQDPDADNDTIPDGEDGIDDSDCDGILDYLDADETDGDCADPDGDGRTNAEEGACASNPSDADTDGDGIADGEESCTEDADCDDLPDILDAETDPAGCTGEDTGGADTGVDCNPGDGFLDCGQYTGGACSAIGTNAALFPALLALIGVLRRRTITATTLGRIGLVGLAAIAPAAAQDAFNAQNFRPAPDGSTLLGVDDAAVPAPGFGASVLFGYAQDPLVYRYDDGSPATRLSGNVGTADIAVFYSFSRLRLAVTMPLHITDGSDIAESGFRSGDLRFDLKGTLLNRHATGFGLAVAIDVGLPTGDASAWVGDSSAVLGGRAIATLGKRRSLLSMNAGVRGGAPAQLLPDLAWGTRFTYGVGGALPVIERLDAFAELNGEIGLVGALALGSAPAEWRAGLRYSPVPGLVATGAFGMGVTTGVGTPDYRILTGLAWVPPGPERRAADVVTAPLPAGEAVAPGELVIVATNDANLPVAALVTVLGGGRKFTTGADGVGTERLPLGDVEVSVWAEGYRPERVKAVLLKNASTKVSVRLHQARAVVREDRVEILDKIFFEFDSATIKAESFRILDEVTEILANHSEIAQIEVQGHSDDQGTDAYNLELSDRRAAAVRDYLVKNGVDGGRLVARGYGESDPLQPGASDEAREANRRVLLKIMLRSGSVRPPDAPAHAPRAGEGPDAKPTPPPDRPKRR